MFELYSTDGCHLCELAHNLLVELQQDNRVKVVDIVDDESLAEQYGTTIPVVRHLGSGQELNWPFDIEQLAGFIHHHLTGA